MRYPGRRRRSDARLRLRACHDGVRQEIVRLGRTRREAETSLDAAVATVLRGADVLIRPTMPLLDAGESWLPQIARPDSGLSARTIADYSWTWQKYAGSSTSSLRGLTLQQANDPQRVRGFLQRVAEAHGVHERADFPEATSARVGERDVQGEPCRSWPDPLSIAASARAKAAPPIGRGRSSGHLAPGLPPPVSGFVPAPPVSPWLSVPPPLSDPVRVSPLPFPSICPLPLLP